MKCPNCGVENRDEVRFCRKCGQPLVEGEEAGGGKIPSPSPAPAPAQAPSTICPGCGATIKAGARFCSRCGQPTQGADESGKATGVAPAPAAPAPAPPSPEEPAPSFERYAAPPEESPGTRPQRPFPEYAEAPQATPPARRGIGGIPRWFWFAIGGIAAVVVIVALAVFAIRLLGDGDEAAEEPGVVTVTPEGGEGAPVGTEGDPEVEEPGEAPGEEPVEGGEPDVPPEEGDGEVAGEEGDEGGEVELPRKEVRVEVLIEPMPPQPGQPYRVQLAVANTLGVTIEVRSYQLVKPELRPALGVDLDRFLMDPISLAPQQNRTIDDEWELIAPGVGELEFQAFVLYEVFEEPGSHFEVAVSEVQYVRLSE